MIQILLIHLPEKLLGRNNMRATATKLCSALCATQYGPIIYAQMSKGKSRKTSETEIDILSSRIMVIYVK